MGSASKYCLVAGVDACRSGWMLVMVRYGEGYGLEDAGVASTFRAVIDRTSSCDAVAVDIPIGLSDRVVHGGRAADRMARQLLHTRLRSSVFPAPPRVVLKAGCWEEAVALAKSVSDTGKGITKQTFAITNKSREVDDDLEAVSST